MIALSTLKLWPVFTRSLVFIWLLTWTMADPLYLLQSLLAPEEYPAEETLSSAPSADLHLTKHHLDVLIGSSTEGNSSRSDGSQSDDRAIGGCIDGRRVDVAWRIMLWIAISSCSSDSAQAAFRAPPPILV